MPASQGYQFTIEGNPQFRSGFEGELTEKMIGREEHKQFMVIGSPHFFQKLIRECASLPTLAGDSILG